MANQNGDKYGFTGLFPIAPGKTAELRTLLRSFADLGTYPRGSPFSAVRIIHMARLFIIDRLAYQGTPAKADTLNSDYLVFLCDFDGTNVDALLRTLAGDMSKEVERIWTCCAGFPGIELHDRLGEYFERCQITTTLFFADQPQATVGEILKGLECRRSFNSLVRRVQSTPRNPDTLKKDFLDMWHDVQGKNPQPGEL